MSNVREIRLKIQQLNELPPLPVAAHKILSLADDTDIKELAKTIEQDPGLAARILGLANAAYFGWPGGVRTIYDAIYKVLGLKLVRSLSIGIILGGLFRADKCDGFSIDRYWFTSMTTAIMAQSLFNQLPAGLRNDLGDIYLDGLLHNLGLPVLVHLFPEEMNQVFTMKNDLGKRSLNDTCTAVLGIDPCRAGGLLARKWHLPADIVCVIENCTDCRYRKDFWAIVLLVGYCSSQADRLFSGDELLREGDIPGSLGIGPAALEQERMAIMDKMESISELAALLATCGTGNG